MSAHAILQIKERLLCTKQKDSRILMEQLLECRTSKELYECLDDFKSCLESKLEV